jgi:hypothetical protein
VRYRVSRAACRSDLPRKRFRPLTDAVEKVGGMLPTRNNRIMGAAFLNRSCPSDARLE